MRHHKSGDLILVEAQEITALLRPLKQRGDPDTWGMPWGPRAVLPTNTETRISTKPFVSYSRTKQCAAPNIDIVTIGRVVWSEGCT